MAKKPLKPNQRVRDAGTGQFRPDGDQFKDPDGTIVDTLPKKPTKPKGKK